MRIVSGRGHETGDAGWARGAGNVSWGTGKGEREAADGGRGRMTGGGYEGGGA